MDNKKEYHILSLSGGKDSTALAFFMRDNMPEIFEKLELVFYDTGCDLPETYDYLNKIEIFLNKKITRVKPEKSFEEIFYTNPIIPSPFKRWCTVLLKVQPSINFINNIINNNNYKKIFLYVGIRADEIHRKGILLNSELEKKYIIPQYPFKDYFIFKSDVKKILDNVGIGIPEYYNWRDRNGCYFCFYQKPIDWVNLYKKYPNLYKKAMEYEKLSYKGKKFRFGWNAKYTLNELVKPKIMNKIISDNIKHLNKEKTNFPMKLYELFT